MIVFPYALRDAGQISFIVPVGSIVLGVSTFPSPFGVNDDNQLLVLADPNQTATELLQIHIIQNVMDFDPSGLEFVGGFDSKTVWASIQRKPLPIPPKAE